MPKVAKELGALAVSKLAHPDPQSDMPVLKPVGGVAGLMLQITPNGAKSWKLRTVVGAKRRNIGLGGYPEISLAVARERATKVKEAVRQGVDPVEQRRATKAALVAAQERNLTFGQAVERYKPIKCAELSSERSRHRWQSGIDRFAKPIIGDKFVADIDISDVLRVLKQSYEHPRTGKNGELWNVATETAFMLRSHIEEILAWATVNGYRTGENPARWKSNLDMTLPAPGKIALKIHHPAVSLIDAPAWFAALNLRDGVSARALEFATLTAARSNDVRGATWSEINLDAALWTVPAARMKIKNNNDHIVPLSNGAVNLLKQLERSSIYVFPHAHGIPLNDKSLTRLMHEMHAERIRADGKGWVDRQSGKPAVVHGLRSTFKDWASEHTEYPNDMSEIALAHKVGSETEQAYRRGTMVEKRRQMMCHWEAFLRGQ